MNEDKMHSSIRSPSSFICSESSNSSNKLSQDSEFERIYSLVDMDYTPIENHMLNPKYRCETKSTEKIYLSRHKTNKPTKPVSIDRRNLSGHFCQSCMKYISVIEELKIKQSVTSEKYLATERHLKQYDNLLQIKDSRLKQQELALKTDLELFEKEKDKLGREQKRLNEEKASFMKEKEYLMMESNRIEFELDELNKKNEELQNLIERKKEEMVMIEQNSSKIELEHKTKLLISREEDIQRLMTELQMYRNEYSFSSQSNKITETEYFDQKKEKYQIKKQKIKKFAEDLYELKEKIESEQKNNFEEFESRMASLTETEKKLLEEKASLEDMQEKVNEEIESINQIKEILKIQQDNLDRQIKLWKEKFETSTESSQRLSRKQSAISPYCQNCNFLLEELEKCQNNCLNCEKLYKKLDDFKNLNEKVKFSDIKYDGKCKNYCKLTDKVKEIEEKSCENCIMLVDKIKIMEQNCENCQNLMKIVNELEKPCKKCKVLEEKCELSRKMNEIEKPCGKCQGNTVDLVKGRALEEKVKKMEKIIMDKEKTSQKNCENCVKLQQALKNIEKPCENCHILKLRIDKLELPCENCSEYEKKLSQPCESCKDYQETIKSLQKNTPKEPVSIKSYDNSNIKLGEYQNMCESLKKEVEVLTGKLKIVECSREEYENENYDLIEQINSIKKKKSILKSKVAELEQIISIDDDGMKRELGRVAKNFSQIQEKNKDIYKEKNTLEHEVRILTLKLEDLELQYDELRLEHDKCLENLNPRKNSDCTEYSGNEIKKLYEELEKKLQQLKIKEKELHDKQIDLEKDQKSIESAADYIKSINEDLAKQQEKINEEKDASDKQRIKFIELDKKQQDKGRLLINKEKELLLLKEKLAERENLIQIKEKILAK
ncbi:hypothetical protein SteCoe_17438 [Stentor coeruleus]|uniref:Uncharacterized protein n=1 Tax=Stentor coeruleus TaxID=5963 RepID=A0A1R2BYY5_9CILI|nr:hypothetical protein SteCoe_17438 [Stentor coeruleus]